MYKSVIFRDFPEWCDRHHRSLSDVVICSVRPLQSTPMLPRAPGATVCFLPPSICFFWTFPVIRITHYVACCPASLTENHGLKVHRHCGRCQVFEAIYGRIIFHHRARPHAVCPFTCPWASLWFAVWAHHKLVSSSLCRHMLLFLLSSVELLGHTT